MSTVKNGLAFFWGVAALYSLCHGIAYRSTDTLLLFAALAPSLAVFLWCMINRTALERRIKRLEARSEIAAERRVVMQTDLTEVEHKLEQVVTKVSSTERIKVTA
jgi:hypothetical protein